MRSTAKFDIAQYVADNSSQSKPEISNTQGLASDYKENKPAEISRLAGLASHNDEVKILSDQEVIQLLRQATYKASVSAQQFWHFCDADDIADIYANEYSLEQLSAYAKSWARYPETVPEGNKQPFPTFEPETVQCRQCQHFIPDKVGDGTGIGHCTINALTNKKGSLRLNSEVICDQHNPIT